MVNTALVADARRRVADGTAASRDLHQILFAAGHDGGWGEVRRAAMAAVAQRPHLAVEVVNLEIQRLGARPVHLDAASGDGGFTAKASLDRDGVTVEGRLCFETSKKRASQLAMVSLLGVLAGEAEPGAGSPLVPSRRSASVALNAADLEAWLDHVVGQAEPGPELAEQLMAGRLTVRSMYLLLFEAEPGGWGRYRTRAWESLVGSAVQAPGVLSITHRHAPGPLRPMWSSAIAPQSRMCPHRTDRSSASPQSPPGSERPVPQPP